MATFVSVPSFKFNFQFTLPTCQLYNPSAGFLGNPIKKYDSQEKFNELAQNLVIDLRELLEGDYPPESICCQRFLQPDILKGKDFVKSCCHANQESSASSSTSLMEGVYNFQNLEISWLGNICSSKRSTSDDYDFFIVDDGSEEGSIFVPQSITPIGFRPVKGRRVHGTAVFAHGKKNKWACKTIAYVGDELIAPPEATRSRSSSICSSKKVPRGKIARRAIEKASNCIARHAAPELFHLQKDAHGTFFLCAGKAPTESQDRDNAESKPHNYVSPAMELEVLGKFDERSNQNVFENNINFQERQRAASTSSLDWCKANKGETITEKVDRNDTAKVETTEQTAVSLVLQSSLSNSLQREHEALKREHEILMQRVMQLELVIQSVGLQKKDTPNRDVSSFETIGDHRKEKKYCSTTSWSSMPRRPSFDFVGPEISEQTLSDSDSQFSFFSSGIEIHIFE
eukprot:g5616.t1